MSEANGLSMTALARLLLPAGVTLSRSEGSVALGKEMLRCAQHDRADLLPRHLCLRVFRLPHRLQLIAPSASQARRDE
jgi:hypothetical protein